MGTASYEMRKDRIRAGDILSDQALSEHSEDEFKHLEIARRVADLVALGKPPFNVALFGPWGSGKSSMARLVQTEFAARQERGGDALSPAFVIYDAWKFGGKSLRRNFISHVAGKLGFVEELGYHDFYRGLYQGRRSFEFKPSALIRSGALSLALLVGLLLLFTLVATVVLALTSWWTAESAWGEIESTLPRLLKAAGPVALAAAAIAFVVQGARAELEQSAPSEAEEFARRFQQLIAEVRKEPRKRQGWKQYPDPATWWRPRRMTERRLGRRLPEWRKHDRLVVFVDELDRCDEEEIVNTLVALRTFLDEEGVVFVVAGDRDALEKALGKTPQPKPINEKSPYYSTASAFLDKIFQHQISLPPLRGRRLNTFARSLVDRQAEAAPTSVWSELKDYDERAYDDVLFALVPGHVSSPRRVKVLLNNFATEARIAQSRGIAWPDRGPEIAKLVVLRTEFPNFAADLFEVPHLPSLFIAPVLDNEPDRVKALVAKQNRSAPDDLLPEEESKLNGGSADAMKTLTNAYRELLRRYLQSTDHIPNPGRDLLFLEPPGEVYGLDAEMSERIERDAPDVPEELAAQLRKEEPDVQDSATRLLADMVGQYGGLERRRTMDALIEVVGHMQEISRVAVPVERALRRYGNADDFRPEHLVVGLRVALEVSPDPAHKRDLVDRLFADERLLGDSARVEAVATMAARLDGGQIDAVKQAIAVFVGGNREVLLGPLRTLPERVANELVDDPGIWTAIEDNLVQNDLLHDIASLPVSRGAFETAFVVRDRMLGIQVPEAYEAVAADVDRVLDNQKADVRVNDLVLNAWQRAPVSDWGLWAGRLRAGALSPRTTERAAATIEILFRAFSGGNDPLGDDSAGFPELVTAMTSLMEDVQADAVSELAAAIGAALEGRRQLADGRDRERSVFKAAVEVAGVNGALAEAVNAVLIEHLRQPVVPPMTEAERLMAVRDMGREMASEAIVALAKDLPKLDWTDRATAAASLYTRLEFAFVLKERGNEDWQEEPFATGVAEMRQAATRTLIAPRIDTPLAIARWIDLGASVADLARVLGALYFSPPPVTDALDKWAGGASPDERTTLALSVIDGRRRQDWMKVLDGHGVDKKRLVESARKRMPNVGNARSRANAASTLSVLRLTDPAAQAELIELMQWLVAPEQALRDAQTALMLVPTLGAAPQHISDLAVIAKKAYERRGKLTEEQGRILRQAGVKVDPAWFGKSVWKRLRDAAAGAVGIQDLG
jgi:KAP-like P-loop domain-containing protein